MKPATFNCTVLRDGHQSLAATRMATEQMLEIAPILDTIRARYADGNMFELDGVSSEYPDWWFNVRASNTEPLLRLIVEADTLELMESKRDELLAVIRG